MPIEEDQVNRGGVLAVSVLPRCRQGDHGLHQFLGPLHEQIPFLAGRLRRTIGHAHDGAAPSRVGPAALTGDHQSPEQVDAVVEVVVLGLDIDPVMDPVFWTSG
jgi:hypothetical protein